MIPIKDVNSSRIRIGPCAQASAGTRSTHYDRAGRRSVVARSRDGLGTHNRACRSTREQEEVSDGLVSRDRRAFLVHEDEAFRRDRQEGREQVVPEFVETASR